MFLFLRPSLFRQSLVSLQSQQAPSYTSCRIKKLFSIKIIKMDSFLIDFDSPKQSRGNVPLIPESLGTWNAPMLFSSNDIESNPFDLVECQVAAKTAAENDPFEMCFSNALNCKEDKSKDTEAPLFECFNNSIKSPKAVAKTMSSSLPDLRKLSGKELPSKIPSGSGTTSYETKNHSIPVVTANDCIKIHNSTSAWNCLEDITPPDFLMNSTVDMSCFFDDTLSTSIINLATLEDTSVLLEENSSPYVTNKITTELKGSHQATYKSDEELRLLTQKKIENLINKAEKDVEHEIEESLVQRRRSIQSLSNPSPEILALCTPRKQSFKTDQTNWSLEKWSENELKKLDLILPNTSNKPTRSKNDSSPAAYLNVPRLYIEEELCLSSLKISTLGDTCTQTSKSPRQLTPVKQKSLSLSNLTSGTDSVKKTSSVSPSSMSPTLLPLPLCEDAVRNLTSLLTSSKPSTSIVSGRKSALKEPATSHSVNRMAQSPRRTLSGSLPNLSSQGSKPPTKLPSPRRSGSVLPPHATNLKKRSESIKEKNSHQNSGLSSSFHHSPRPLRKSSSCRTGNHARVLAEINTCPSARMSPKCRVNQAETPRRGRSMLTEKENYM
ncbi:hypothetical protein FOCC_FOCC001852 [Frankliniella occidentalis]|nr:hypothetical protein FOCC_FOCC001852 [Frankliniella occidentalis]